MPDLSNIDVWWTEGEPYTGAPPLEFQLSTIDVVFIPVIDPTPPTPPVVSNVTPTPGTAITATTPVGLDVTDDSGVFRRIMLVASFPTLGLLEVVHDGDNFAPLYAGTGNTREAIANGFRYAALRRGGWPASPTLIPFAIDQEGAEAA